MLTPKLRFAIILALVSMAAFYVTRVYDVTVERRHQYHGPEYVPSYQWPRGPQIELLFVGSARCRWSSDPTVVAAVRSLKESLRSEATANGLGFRAIAVAVDWSPETGFAFLKRFGHFDEVSAGYSWGNTVASARLWTAEGSEVSTPSIYIYRRTAGLLGDSAVGPHLETDRRLIARYDGVAAISDIAANRAPEWFFQ